MNLEIAKLAISSLEEEFGKLPTTGFLAGGAIANRIFELKTGRKMPINDIDIFHFDSELLDIEYAHRDYYMVDNKKCFHAELKDEAIEDRYGNYIIKTKTSKGYIVKEVKREGILNEIVVKSSHLDPKLILDSFDLNCTQIGYDLETKQFYSTKEWCNFLENEKIQLTSLHTPCHSLLRILKKSEEFGIPIEDGEFEILRYSLDHPIGFQRRLFSNKYKSISDKYQDFLKEKNFVVTEEKYSSNYLFSKIGKAVELWTIKNSKMDINFDTVSTSYFPDWIFNPLSVFSNSNKLIWAYRNIYPKKELHEIWNSLHQLYDIGVSFDKLSEMSNSKLEFLSRLYTISPNLINHIETNGYSFEQHLNYVERIWKTFDPPVALCLCQKQNFPFDWNESDELLMELSVRWKSSKDNTIKHSNELVVLWNRISNI